MKTCTRNKLLEAIKYCDENDKSTEFMIAYMMDTANVDFDCAVNFLTKNYFTEIVKKTKDDSKNLSN